MVTDNFILMDENGTVIAEKQIAEHIKVFLDEMHPGQGRAFTVKSEETGLELNVTDKTSQEDWREYSYKCLRALD